MRFVRRFGGLTLAAGQLSSQHCPIEHTHIYITECKRPEPTVSVPLC